MKTIGIIGAMDEEIEILKNKAEIISVKKIVDREFILGNLCGANVIIVRSGIGKVNAAICVQVLCDLFGVDYVINTGVAGGLAPGLSVRDIVISSELVQHDFDATSFGYDYGIIPRMPVSIFEADPALIALAEAAVHAEVPEQKIVVGRIASGDLFVSKKEDSRRIYERFNAVCAEMEGAAIAHVCYLNRIPFVVIRSMSDTADGGALEDYNSYVEIAAKQSCAIVMNMIQNI